MSLPTTALAAALALFAAAGSPGDDPWPFGDARANPPAAAPAQPDALTSIRDRLADVSKPFTLVVRLELKPESVAEFTGLALTAQEATRREPGALTYEFSKSSQTPTSIVLYEHWRSFGDLEKHFQSEATKALLGKLGDLTAKPPQIDVYLPFEPGH